jgi:predicted O-methyltransferase YrrM
VFRLQHYLSDDWELGEECFIFYKIRELVDQYARFWALHSDFHAEQVLELGLWDGGSAAFWFEYFRPAKLVGIDISRRGDSAYFAKYKLSRNLEQRIKTYWGVDQGNARRLREIVAEEFSDPIDVVIDDASHMYGPTRECFETLFPLVRPGGLYIIEDWAWACWPEFQSPEHAWATETPLSKLVFELVEVTGSSTDLVSGLAVHQGFVVIERGTLELDVSRSFKLDAHITRRSRISLLSGLPARTRRYVRRKLGGW